MVEILPEGSTAGHRAVLRLLESRRDEGEDLPPRVFVECPDDEWQRHAVSLPTLERRRSVLVAASEAALLDAVRLEIGGAARLPVSTHALMMACEAAADSSKGGAACIATRAVLEMVLERGPGLWLVGWRPAAFWYHQVGASRLIGVLQEIARRLACIPAIIPGPFLVVGGRRRSEVEDACRVDDQSCGGLIPILPTCVEMAAPAGPDGGARVEALMAAVGRDEEDADSGDPKGFRVMELPSGHQLGRWSLTVADGADEGWMAVPELQGRDPGVWRMEDSEGNRLIRESTWSDELDRPDQSVLRVPGWIGAALQPGRPASLLVEILAGNEALAGRPLWVPSVDADGVRFLLGLPGPIWVDGPGVPGF